MTPKEKAKELIYKYFNWYGDEFYFSLEKAKEAALICVDEIRRIPSVQVAYSQGYKSKSKSTESYWVEVKKEIEKL